VGEVPHRGKKPIKRAITPNERFSVRKKFPRGK
jgi:hypothetical protein